MTKRHNLIGISICLVVIAASLVWVELRPSKIPDSKPTTNVTTASTDNDQSKGFDKGLYSISEADSIWVIVNKQRKLIDNFIPPDLVVPKVKLRLSADSEQMKVRATTATAMEELFKAASTAGYQLMLGSGYRSQSYQKSLYEGYVATDGQLAADRSSARPGHSEHQTGLAFDIEPENKKCELDQCFGDLLEGRWIAAHVFEYGFIIRYGKDQEQLTGYEYEPWHLRFVGKDLAKELTDKHLTLEQFFGLQPALNY